MLFDAGTMELSLSAGVPTGLLFAVLAVAAAWFLAGRVPHPEQLGVSSDICSIFLLSSLIVSNKCFLPFIHKC